MIIQGFVLVEPEVLGNTIRSFFVSHIIVFEYLINDAVDQRREIAVLGKEESRETVEMLSSEMSH